MARISTIVWLLIIVVATFSLYLVKYQVHAIRQQITDISKQLEVEKEGLHVVAAEWAYLNRPQRLQNLSSKYLGNTGLTVDRVADLEAIPFSATLAQKTEKSLVQPVSAKVDPEVGDQE
ncbi:MAG: hypothetical protein SFT92_00685 [Rickettsiales bacterium]|nr:hypothetical protein [Rickettsiales bacterium]